MKLGPHELIAEIGRGGAGIVFRARTPEGRLVAVKLLQNGEARARFERERRILAELGEDAGFVTLLDAGEAPQGPWFSMPLLEGSLRQGLARGPLPLDEALALGRTLARALAAAHARGIVHRDLKPENVLFDATGRPLIADLGLGKHFEPGASASLSRTNEMRGTAGYMAPEQMRDAKSAGPPADVFALGAIVHECLTGVPAFAGRTFVEVVARVEAGEVPSVRVGRPEAPRWLDAALRRALARDPALRPDAAAFARALEEPAPRRGVGALVARGSSVALLAVIAVTAAVTAGVAAFVLRRSDSPRPPTRVVPAPPRAPARPDERDVLLARARAALRAWETDAALEDVERVLARAPSRVEALCLRALLRMRRGETERALADATRSVELAPGTALAWSTRGAAKVHAADLDGAAADLARALELDSRDATAWGYRGTLADVRGRPADAISDLTLAVVLDPREASWWLGRSSARQHVNDLQGALEDARVAARLAPKLATAWLNVATIRQLLGDLDGALEDHARALALDPRNADLLTARARCRIARREFAEALEDARRAVELAPDRAAAWCIRGTAFNGAGQPQAALADWDRALDMDPTLRDARANRAAVRDQTGDYKGAIEDASVLLETRDDFDNRIVRGHARAYSGDYDGAIPDLTRAIELEPGRPGPWAIRAHAHRQKKDLAAARTDLDRAIELDPTYFFAWYQRGSVRLEQGDRKGAIEDWRKVLELVPDGPDAEAVRAEIARVEKE